MSDAVRFAGLRDGEPAFFGDTAMVDGVINYLAPLPAWLTTALAGPLTLEMRETSVGPKPALRCGDAMIDSYGWVVSGNPIRLYGPAEYAALQR